MRIGLIQMLSEKGAVESNLAATIALFEKAARLGVEILAFPEASLSGYIDPLRYPEAVLRLDGPEIARLAAATRGHPFSVLAGLIEHNPDGKPFVTHVVVRDGQVQGVQRKIRNLEEDAEYYACGDKNEIGIFEHGGGRFGISICADIALEEIPRRCAESGARLCFELAAPGLYGDQAARNWQSGFEWWRGECQKYLASYARRYGLWIGAATQAGRTRDEDFPGGGYLFAPGGELVFATPDWQPGEAYLEFDLESGAVRSL
jgi:predicted amidohydrolase